MFVAMLQNDGAAAAAAVVMLWITGRTAAGLRIRPVSSETQAILSCVAARVHLR